MAYIGNSPTSAAFVTDSFSGNASTLAFTMSVSPANPSSALVAISGILQDPTTYSVSGTTLTFSSAPPVGTGNISVRYLGIPASGVTTTAYRTVTEFTATAGQTTFSPASYTVGFITVYRNGVRLGTADYTATNGTSVVLNNACTVGDLVTTEAMLVSSVVNALPQTGGTVAGNMVVSGTLSASGSAILGTSAASLALSVKSPSDYRAAIFETASTLGPSVQIKGSKTYELRSTNTTASEGGGLFFIYDKDNEASRLTIDSTGNMGIGFTPQTSGALPKAIELNYGAISTYNGSEFDLSANAYITTNAWTYKTTAAATLFQQTGGQFSFQSAASGTAGTNCSFTERARIDTNGSLFVNAGVVCFTTSQYRSTVASSQLQFINNSAGVSLAVNGTSWGSLSDERDKEIIEPITNAISKVSALRSVIGRYKVDDEDKRRAFLIAQDVKEVLPEAVTELDDENKTLILQYTETIPLLVAAIKELKEIVDAQAVEIAALKAK